MKLNLAGSFLLLRIHQKIYVHFFRIALLLLCFGALNADAQDYQIFSIKAFMFYNKEETHSDVARAGGFSDNVIDNKDAVLWNVIIGEGSAEGFSDQTLIVVESGLTPGSVSTERTTLKVEVFAGEQNVYSDETDILFFRDKHYFHACMINDTGCSKLLIRATLLETRSKKVLAVLEKTVDYECGE
jgi:hypothetical protein